jgi:hypothetical protein
MQNGRRTWPNVAKSMQNAKWPCQKSSKYYAKWQILVPNCSQGPPPRISPTKVAYPLFCLPPPAPAPVHLFSHCFHQMVSVRCLCEPDQSPKAPDPSCHSPCLDVGCSCSQLLVCWRMHCHFTSCCQVVVQNLFWNLGRPPSQDGVEMGWACSPPS